MTNIKKLFFLNFLISFSVIILFLFFGDLSEIDFVKKSFIFSIFSLTNIYYFISTVETQDFLFRNPFFFKIFFDTIFQAITITYLLKIQFKFKNYITILFLKKLSTIYFLLSLTYFINIYFSNFFFILLSAVILVIYNIKNSRVLNKFILFLVPLNLLFGSLIFYYFMNNIEFNYIYRATQNINKIEKKEFFLKYRIDNKFTNFSFNCTEFKEECGKENIVLYGDTQALQYFPSLENTLEYKKIDIYFSKECSLFKNINLFSFTNLIDFKKKKLACENLKSDFFDKLMNSKIDKIILAFWYNSYINKKIFLDQDNKFITQKDTKINKLFYELDEFIKILPANKIYLVLPIPEFLHSADVCIINKKNCNKTQKNYFKFYQIIQQKFLELQKGNESLEVINLHNLLCDKKLSTCSMIDKNNKLIYRDKENIGVNNINTITLEFKKILM